MRNLLIVIMALACSIALPAKADTLPNKPEPHYSSVTAPFHDKQIMTLGFIQTGSLIADGISTREAVLRGAHEADPAAKVFIGRYPTWSRMAPIGTVEAIGAAYLAERLKHGRLHKIWWLPQALCIGEHAGGTIVNIKLLESGVLDRTAPTRVQPYTFVRHVHFH